jgi:hypothetical protein
MAMLLQGRSRIIASMLPAGKIALHNVMAILPSLHHVKLYIRLISGLENMNEEGDYGF